MIFLMHFAKKYFLFFHSTMMLPFANDLLIYFFPILIYQQTKHVTHKHTDKQTYNFFSFLTFVANSITHKKEREVGTFTIRFIDVTLIY